MSRLEIIHLRTAGNSFGSLTRQIREALGSGVGGAGIVTLYRRHGLETDVAIHITCHGSGEKSGPSTFGLHVASAMSAYGLVEHTVWEELT